MDFIFRLMLLAAALLAVLQPQEAMAEPTQVTVRVLAHDAKFIGTGMGGIRVILRNADSGEILDQGLIEGSTGDTGDLVVHPRERQVQLSRSGGAQWVGTIDIDAPTRIKVEAQGPLAAGSNVQQASVTFWALPGQHVAGDGILLTLYGLTVHPVSPAPHQNFRPGAEVFVEAHVVTLCGCPIMPGGLWDADKYQIRALVHSAEGPVTEFPLEFTGTVNRFAGRFTPPQAGSYKIFITAADEAQNNYGVGITSIVVR